MGQMGLYFYFFTEPVERAVETCGRVYTMPRGEYEVWSDECAGACGWEVLPAHRAPAQLDPQPDGTGGRGLGVADSVASDDGGGGVGMCGECGGGGGGGGVSEQQTP